MKFHCPNCNQRIEADDSYAGKTVDCPACSKAFAVPFPEKVSPPRPTEILPPEIEGSQWFSWNPISVWNALPNSAGIYEIKNSVSGLSYIGSAKALRRRGHYKSLSTDSSHSKILQQAFDSDGEESFQFRVLEFCDKDKRIEREQKYMDERDFNTLYNAAPNAGTGRGYVFTDAQREKLSRAKKGTIISDEARKSVWIKKQEREFKKELYAKLFKDFKKTDKYQSLVKEIKDYANAAPNRRKPVAWELDDGDFNMGTNLQTWWAFGGGREYVDEKFEFTKCDWKHICGTTADLNKLDLEQGYGNSKLYKLIAESIFNRDIEADIEAAFEDAVKTGEVNLQYKTPAQRQEERDRYMAESMKESEAIYKALRKHQGMGLWGLWNYLCKILGFLRNLFVKKQEEQVILGPVPCEGWIKIGDCKAHYLTHREDDCYKSLCGREKWRYQDYQIKFCHDEPNIEDRCKTCEKNRLKRIK